MPSQEGSIPGKICGPSLRRLLLADNDLSGVVPLESCSSLKWLTLSNNRLTSHIPPELGLMPRINFLHLSNNSLSGTIPPTLGNCRYLVWLDLSSNELEGMRADQASGEGNKRNAQHWFAIRVF